jgi:hypothetical protein
MNRLLLTGLVVAILAVVVYVIAGVRNRKKPELADGIVVFIGAVSVFGAIRLIGCALTGQFAKIAPAQHDSGWWILSSEDAVFVVIGGIALAWVSIQTIWESFAKIRKSPVVVPAKNPTIADPTPDREQRKLASVSDNVANNRR